MAAASPPLIDALLASPGMAEIFRSITPGIDIATTAGFLQLAFADQRLLLVGLASTMFAAYLRLPDWVAQLALTTQLGEPMIGSWGVGRILACLVLAFGGLILGAWGMPRRDVGD